MTDGFTAVADKLEGQGERFMARCPAHEDSRASLSIARGDDGRALIHCFAGCSTPDVVAALGLDLRDLFGGERGSYDADYAIYRDEAGAPLFRVVREWPKGFRQEKWDEERGVWRKRLFDARRVLYRLPQIQHEPRVWIVEGEKDAETLTQEGVAGATTVPGGAGKWREEYAELLRGKRVDIVADNDKSGTGLQGALKVKNGLRGAATRTDVWLPPEGYKDVTSMYLAGLGLGDLVPYVPDDATFEPQDWTNYQAEPVEWLLEPYVPAHSRVLAFGPAGSLKSLFALWLAAKLAHAGHRVAYFNLEMTPREINKRLVRLDPPKDKFRLYRKLSFDSAGDLAAAQDLLKGFSLIVVDSWSAVHGDTNNNDAVSRLDREFFLPLVEETGATLLILDNTGQAVMTDRGKAMPDWARGASAKGDKMDHTLFFDRPDENDNHMARIKIQKIRGDEKKPRPLRIKTGQGAIDFRIVDEHGTDLGPFWPGDGGVRLPAAPVPDAPASLLDRLRLAKERDRLGEES